ncbi:MAG: hypothetical protein ACHRXM_28575 [Isosphaerales bacterium]
MRQVGDTLVWLAMIGVIAAVIYFTPRVARYVGAMGGEHGRECTTCREIEYQQDEPPELTQ